MQNSPSGHNVSGELVSLWVATAGEAEYPSLAGELRVDVAVIGGGIAGLTTALALKRAGRSVAVLEAGRVGTGVTGHTTGKVTSLQRLTYRDLLRGIGYRGARQYGHANQFAIEHMAAVVEQEGIECDFRRVDNYTFAQSPHALPWIREEVNLAARMGLPAEYVTETPLPFPVAGAVRFTRQAQIHAGKYVQGLARVVNGDGGFVFEHTRVRDVEEGTPCAVLAAEGRVIAGNVVVATNMPFLDRGAFFLRCHPHRSYIVAGRIDAPPLDGTFISADEPLRSILSARVGEETFLLIGGEGHRVSESGDPADRYGRLADYARERFGIEKLAYRWSTQDAMPLDGVPYAGKIMPWAKKLYVITGLRKWGLTNGTVAACIIADTILGRPNPWADLFDSNRISLLPSAGRFFHENFLAAKEIVGNFFRSAQPHDSLEPGAAAVIVSGGQKIAIHKDLDGQVHAVSVICTHQGCTVEWNGADATWDCPCHGSRFAPNGTVLHGPAVTNLAVRAVPKNTDPS